jgi:hypothetical protein
VTLKHNRNRITDILPINLFSIIIIFEKISQMGINLSTLGVIAKVLLAIGAAIVFAYKYFKHDEDNDEGRGQRRKIAYYPPMGID